MLLKKHKISHLFFLQIHDCRNEECKCSWDIRFYIYDDFIRVCVLGCIVILSGSTFSNNSSAGYVYFSNPKSCSCIPLVFSWVTSL